MSVAVPVTQTCQWRFLSHRQVGGGFCYRDTSVVVPITLLFYRQVASGPSLHRQVSGGPCYTDRLMGIPVTQTGQWRFLSHKQVSGCSCHTDRSVAVPVELFLSHIHVSVK